MSAKGTGEMTIITSSVNAQDFEILDTFLVPSIKRMFGGDGNFSA